jgi:hypothetical protein
MTIFKNLRSNKTAQEKTRTSNLITSGLKGIGNLTGLRKKSNVTAETKQQAVNASKSLENLKTPAKAKFVSFVANRLLDKGTASKINNNLNIHNTVYQQQAGEANNPRLQFREKLGVLIGNTISGKLSTNDTKKAQQILLNQNQGTLKKLVNDANKIFANPSLTKSDSHKLTMDTLEMAGLVKREVKDNKPTYSLVKKPTGNVKSAQALYEEQASSDMPTSNRLQYGNKEEAEKVAAVANEKKEKAALELFSHLPEVEDYRDISISKASTKTELTDSDIIIPNINGGMAEIRTKIDNNYFGDNEIIITDDKGIVSNITNKKELKTDFKQGDVIITDDKGIVSNIKNEKEFKKEQNMLEKTPAGSKFRAEQRAKAEKVAQEAQTKAIHDAQTVLTSNVSQKYQQVEI